jgi:phospholipid N-methyltransferase
MSVSPKFFLHPFRYGAFCPSSAALCRAMTTHVGLETARVVLELGSGTGAITRVILNRASKAESIVAVELDEKLCEELRAKFPTVTILNENAIRLRDVLAEKGLRQPECIISGLPWANFSPKLQNAILENVYESLAPGGIFATFAYFTGFFVPTGWSFRKKIKQMFSSVETSSWILKNIPPAFVYYCKK